MSMATRNRLLAFVAILLAVAGLRLSHPVMMPLAVAAADRGDLALGAGVPSLDRLHSIGESS
jgi:hypothetical protein